MGEDLLAEYCAPVLAKIKPSNLFTVSNSSYDVDDLIARWNGEYNQYDIYFKKVSSREKASSVLCFRKSHLCKCINSCDTKCYLQANGYDTGKIDRCIDCVCNKLCQNEFPHEIGLFLGYPFEDVKGFIENKGQNYLMSGYWKVYEDREAKEEIFNLYKKTRLEFKEYVEKGNSVKELINI